MHSLNELLDDEAWLKPYREAEAVSVVAQEERRREERAQKASSLKARLPEFLRDRQPSELLAAIKSELVRRAAVEWCPEHGNLLLLGETDTGKSTAAGYICRRIIAAGVVEGGEMWELALGIYWIHAAKLEKAIQAQPFGRGPCRELVLASEARLFVLDDAGWERDPRNVAPVLADRYDAGLKSIITSGLTVGELRGAEVGDSVQAGRFPGYGAAVMRRLATTHGRRGTIVRAFPKMDADRKKREEAARARGESDQEEVARRQGERL